MVKAIIFDMDGLIVDSEPIQLKSLNRVLKSYEIQLDESDWMSFVGKRAIDNMTVIKQRFSAEFDPHDLLVHQKKIYSEMITSEIQLMPGVKYALDFCSSKKLRIILASSSPCDEIATILSHHKIIQYFDFIIGGDEVKKGKPDPEIFLKAAEKMKLQSSDCVVLEDSIAGAKAAISANMFCIVIPNKYTKHQNFEFANMILNSLLDLNSAVVDQLSNR